MMPPMVTDQVPVPLPSSHRAQGRRRSTLHINALALVRPLQSVYMIVRLMGSHSHRMSVRHWLLVIGPCSGYCCRPLYASLSYVGCAFVISTGSSVVEFFCCSVDPASYCPFFGL